MKNKFTKIFILSLVFIFGLQATGFSEVIDLRDEGKFSGTDALLAAFVGYITSSSPGPGATLYKVFASTYVTPVLTSQIIKALHVKNRFAVMAMQLGFSAGIKGALLSGTGGEAAKDIGKKKIEEKAKEGLLKTIGKATVKELKAAGGSFKQGFASIATKQAAKAFVSGLVRGAAYAVTFAVIQKSVERSTKNTELAQFLGTAGAMLVGQLGGMALKEAGLLPEGETVGTKDFLKQYAITIASGGTELGLKALGMKAELGVLTSAGLTSMLQSIMYRPSPPEAQDIAEGEQNDKDIILVEGVREGLGVEGTKLTNLTKTGSDELLEIKKLKVENLSYDQKTLLKEKGILKEDGSIDQKQLKKIAVELQLQKADRTSRIEKARMSTKEAAFEGAKRAALSMALQYLSLKTKSPVHGAYLNLAITSLAKSGLILLFTKGNIFELGAGQEEEGKESIEPGLKKSKIKGIFRFIDAQIGKNVADAQGDFMTMGQYQVEGKGGLLEVSESGPRNEVFFMSRYLDYVMSVHDSGFASAAIDQALSAIHNQSVGNLNDIVDGTVGRFYNRSSPLVKLYYIDMRGATARQLTDSAKAVMAAAEGTAYKEELGGELKRVPGIIPVIGHGGPETTLGAVEGDLAALDALSNGKAISKEDAARLKESGVIKEGAELSADEQGRVSVAGENIVQGKEKKLVDLRDAIKNNIALHKRAAESYHNVSRFKTLEASFTRSELQPDAEGHYPEYGQREAALGRRVDERYNEDAAGNHNEAVSVADAVVGVVEGEEDTDKRRDSREWQDAYNAAVDVQKSVIRQGAEKEQQVKLDIVRSLIGTKRIYLDAWEAPPPSPPQPVIELAPVVERPCIVVKLNIAFDLGYAHYTPEKRQEAVAALAGQLKEIGNVGIILMDVGADYRGSEKINQGLAGERENYSKELVQEAMQEAGLGPEQVTVVASQDLHRGQAVSPADMQALQEQRTAGIKFDPDPNMESVVLSIAPQLREIEFTPTAGGTAGFNQIVSQAKEYYKGSDVGVNVEKQVLDYLKSKGVRIQDIKAGKAVKVGVEAGGELEIKKQEQPAPQPEQPAATPPAPAPTAPAPTPAAPASAPASQVGPVGEFDSSITPQSRDAFDRSREAGIPPQASGIDRTRPRQEQPAPAPASRAEPVGEFDSSIPSRIDNALDRFEGPGIPPQASGFDRSGPRQPAPQAPQPEQPAATPPAPAPTAPAPTPAAPASAPASQVGPVGEFDSSIPSRIGDALDRFEGPGIPPQASGFDRSGPRQPAPAVPQPEQPAIAPAPAAPEARPTPAAPATPAPETMPAAPTILPPEVRPAVPATPSSGVISAPAADPNAFKVQVRQSLLANEDGALDKLLDGKINTVIQKKKFEIDDRVEKVATPQAIEARLPAKIEAGAKQAYDDAYGNEMAVQQNRVMEPLVQKRVQEQSSEIERKAASIADAYVQGITEEDGYVVQEKSILPPMAKPIDIDKIQSESASPISRKEAVVRYFKGTGVSDNDAKNMAAEYYTMFGGDNAGVRRMVPLTAPENAQKAKENVVWAKQYNLAVRDQIEGYEDGRRGIRDQVYRENKDSPEVKRQIGAEQRSMETKAKEKGEEAAVEYKRQLTPQDKYNLEKSVREDITTEEMVRVKTEIRTELETSAGGADKFRNNLIDNEVERISLRQRPILERRLREESPASGQAEFRAFKKEIGVSGKTPGATMTSPEPVRAAVGLGVNDTFSQKISGLKNASSAEGFFDSPQEIVVTPKEVLQHFYGDKTNEVIERSPGLDKARLDEKFVVKFSDNLGPDTVGGMKYDGGALQGGTRVGRVELNLNELRRGASAEEMMDAIGHEVMHSQHGDYVFAQVTQGKSPEAIQAVREAYLTGKEVEGPYKAEAKQILSEFGRNFQNSETANLWAFKDMTPSALKNIPGLETTSDSALNYNRSEFENRLKEKMRMSPKIDVGTAEAFTSNLTSYLLQDTEMVAWTVEGMRRYGAKPANFEEFKAMFEAWTKDAKNNNGNTYGGSVKALVDMLDVAEDTMKWKDPVAKTELDPAWQQQAVRFKENVLRKMFDSTQKFAPLLEKIPEKQPKLDLDDDKSA